MPRNSSGTYTLPSGQPVTTGTVISSSVFNTLTADLATALTDSLSRSGDGGMTAPLNLTDGAIGAPGLRFGSELTSGFYRAGAGDHRYSISATEVARLTAAGVTALALIPSGATVPANGLYLPSANTVGIASNTTLRWSVNSTGNHTIAAPSSGVALTLIASGYPTQTLNAGAETGYSAIQLGNAAASRRLEILYVGTGASTTYGVPAGSVGINAGSTGLYLSTADAARVVIGAAGNVTINAPSSGAALTVNGPANSQQIVLDSPSGWGGVQWRQNGALRWSALNDFDAAGEWALYSHTTGSSRIRVTGAGNVTIAAPSSGATLVATVGASLVGQRWTDGTRILEVQQDAGGSYLGTTTASPFTVFTNNAQRVAVSAAGNVTINAPSSSTTLTVASLDAAYGTAWTCSAAVSALLLGFNVGLQSSAWNILSGSNDPLAIGSAGTGSLNFWTNSVGRMSISSNGNITMSAPGSGNALTVNGVNGSYVVSLLAGTTSSASFGLTVAAGTNSNDMCAQFLSRAGSELLEVRGDGRVTFAGISTTASAANAFLDSGASNSLLRSTSSRRYKTDIEELADPTEQLLGLRPVTYRSKAEADDPTLRWYGLVAEDVAEVVPRLVQFVNGEPDGMQYDRLGVLMLAWMQRAEARLRKLENYI